jgi:DNA replication protein DnaC
VTAGSVEFATIRQHCKTLRMPTVASQFQKLAEQAQRDKQSHVRYLDVLLGAEVDEREHRAIQRRLKEAQLPRTKTLEEFDFAQSPKVSGRRLRELAEGQYIDRAQPVIFLGDAGTGKTHLATALCVAACQQRRRVRFTTASRLVNELVEARQEHELSRVIRRYARFELLCIDELGYVPLADVGAELLFQVISERSETAAVVITTNLPFSEWTQVFTNARLCKALLDRVTDQAHILETGTESYRFRRTARRTQSGTKA